MPGFLKSRNRKVRSYSEIAQGYFNELQRLNSEYSFMALDPNEYEAKRYYLVEYKGSLSHAEFDQYMLKDPVSNVEGYGIFTHPSLPARLDALEAKYRMELEAGYASDPTGEGWIADAFWYEICNYEFMYDQSKYKMAQILGEMRLTKARYESDPRFRRGLQVALRRMEERGW